MTGKTIIIKTADGEMGGYLAAPASGKGPGVVVLQEIFGVNQNIRDIADSLAAQGFFALAPDIYWRIQPNIQLTDQTDAEWQQALAYMKRFDIDTGMKDIQAAITTLRGLPGVNGKVGSVGYCLGGQLAYLTASRTDVDAAVGFYAVMLQNRLEEKIAHPLMLHIADEDEFSSHENRDKVIAGLKDNPYVTLHRYAGMNHAFARVGGKCYDKAFADLANNRTLAFFKKELI